MATTLTLTDGTTTLDLNQVGGAYELEADASGQALWRPGISQLAADGLSASPYRPVLEEIPLIIRETGGVTVHARLRALYQMIEAIYQHRRGYGIPQHSLTYNPHGSTVTGSLTGYILDVPERAIETDGSVISLSNATAMRVTLRLIRREWRGASESATSSAVSTCQIFECLFGSNHTAPSAVRFETDGALWINGDATTPFYVIATDQGGTDGLRVENASAVSPGAPFSTPAPGASERARAATLLRYTPTGTGYAQTSILMQPGGPLSYATRRAHVYVTARSSSASVAWSLRLAGTDSGLANTLYSRPVRVTLPANYPTPLYVGSIYCSSSGAVIRIEVAASTTSGSPTLDLDQYVVLDQTTGRPWSHAITLVDTGRAKAIGDEDFGPQAITRSTARLLSWRGPLPYYAYRRVGLSYHEGTDVIRGVILCCAGGANAWTLGSGTTKATSAVVAIRHPAYPVAE